jgi:signal transduction histidine kinase
VSDVLTPLRTLVIEDCEEDHDLLLLKLSEAGFAPSALRIETIGEIEEAFKANEWQIVFSDFDLPGFDGLRALELVRAINSETPFFIVSGVIDEEQAVAAMKAGAQDYFFKGKLARLGPAVHRELHEAEERRQRREARVELDRDRNQLRHDRIRFVDVMSHEIRTPLNIINVAAGLLSRYGERMGQSGREERTAEIQDAVIRMTRVIDKVLLTSRLELRRWDLKSETFDPAAWCEEFLCNRIGDSGLCNRIRVKFNNLPPKVAMDQRVLEIALQNLLSNALKYSAPESLVDLELSGDVPGRILFSVRDCGIGIPETDMPHILESFYRGANVGDVPGTGLGLPIVKACTDLHGGTLEIASSPGGGTYIKLCLPDGLRLLEAAQDVPASPLEVIQGCPEY